VNGSQWDGAGEEPTPGTAESPQTPQKRRKRWPLLLMGAGGSVTIWGGWAGLGRMTGFGKVYLLPGIWDSFHINTIITLPIGMEAYAAYGFGVWLDRSAPKPARLFAMWSSLVSVILGMAGQAEYHHLVTTHQKVAPGLVVMAVSCLPVMAVMFGALLYHLQDEEEKAADSQAQSAPPQTEPAPAVPAPIRPAVESPTLESTAAIPTEPVPTLALPTPAPRPALEPPAVEPMDPVSPVAVTEPTPAPVPTVSPPGAAEASSGTGNSPTLPKPRVSRTAVEPAHRAAQTVGTRRIVLRDAAELLPRAREINKAWREIHGNDISGNALSKQMKIHKTTANTLMKIIKADNGAGDGQAAGQ
jgi:hypothetical protein